MHCKICRANAVAEVPQHNMALCRSCYLDWFPRYALKAIRKFRMFTRDERVLVAVSGGKDSQVLWRVLHEAGYQVDGMVIDLGIGDDGGSAAPGEGYSAASTRTVVQLAEQLERPLWIVDLRVLMGQTVPQVRRGARPVCSACGLVKRYVMNRVAWEGGYDCVATGHNLDDEVAALFGNVLSWDTHFLARQHPVSPQVGERLMRRVKPFCYFTERETAMYAMLSGTPYFHEECPNSAGATSIAYKELLNRLEVTARGSKRHFFDGFLRQRELFRNAEEHADMSYCGHCGMPSPLATCALCRMIGEAPMTRLGAVAALRPAGAPEPRVAAALA